VNAKLKVYTSEPTLVDFALVESGIKRRLVNDDNRSKAFSKYVLEGHFDIAASDVDQHLVDGGNDRGIDFVYIDHERRIINIGNCKCVGSFNKAKKNFPGGEIDKIITFVSDLLGHNDEMLGTANGDLSAKIREIWDLYENGDLYKTEMHLFSNQLCLVEGERARLEESLSKYAIALRQHGLYQLAHGLICASKPKFKKKIHPLKDSSFKITEQKYCGWQTRVSIKEIFGFLKGIDGFSFDERLIEQNVRYYLGPDNSVNREIRETLLSADADEFWSLNNGLTLVCDQIMAIGNCNHPMTLVNPKIVNGGQTANVIFEVGAETLSKLERGAVALKIIETRDESFIERIALASNTQSRISGRDLKAFDPFQEKLAVSIEELVARFSQIAGYRCLSLMRAFGVVKRQLALA
jgi:hypothetical protein